MGHSIQIVADRLEIINDLDLFALIAIITTEPYNKRFTSLNKCLVAWRNQIEVSGPGTIELNLEAIFADDSARIDMLSLLTEIENEYKRRGDAIPASVLNERCRAAGVIFNDYATRFLFSTTEAIRRLLLTPM